MTENLNAYEYTIGTYTPIVDPCDAHIEACEGDLEEGLTEAGYAMRFQLGSLDGFNVDVYSQSDRQTEYPYLVMVTTDGGFVESFYCKTPPDYLDLLNKLSTIAIAALISEFRRDYKGEIDILMEPARKQEEARRARIRIQNAARERTRKQK